MVLVSQERKPLGCYHQRNSKRSSPADSKNIKYETFVADSNMTNCEQRSCDKKTGK